MKLAVFGGAGKTGQALIARAIKDGHEVTALARKPDMLSAHRGIRIVAGDAREAAPAAECIKGAEAVICLIGSFNRKPNTEVSDATKSILSAIDAHGAKRGVFVTTIGTGDSLKPMKSFVFKHIIIGMIAKEVWADRNRQEGLIQTSASAWTIVRPGGLRDEPAAGRYIVAPSNGPIPQRPVIARDDVAAFCLKAMSDNALVRKTVCLFNPA
jgi:uncharacterized protein YbjT (DUF2867 family)